MPEWRPKRPADPRTLQIHIGIHTGPVVAGVIGTQKFIFDIWGETVNTASRLESHRLPGRIAVSAETYRRLHQSHEFEPRGIINLGGSGPMESHFLQGRMVLLEVQQGNVL